MSTALDREIDLNTKLHAALFEAREELKRLQRQVDRLGKKNSQLQSQLLEAVAMKVDVPFESFAEMRSREKDRY